MDHPRPGLPIALTTFVGREHELESLASLLQPGSGTRIVTLTGTAGTGKTRLALQAVAGVVDEYPDGAAFVDLAALSRPEQVATAILAALFLKSAPYDSHDAALLAAAAIRHMILLLDNCEHLVAEVGRVVDLMTANAPLVTICCTSREPLGCSGEWQLPVAPLPFPPRARLLPVSNPVRSSDELLRYDAVRLFCARAAQARPDFVLDDENQDAVVDICRHVEG
ncbi:MAG: ATP-binding protein, partial [Caldilineaceae bacterium]